MKRIGFFIFTFLVLTAACFFVIEKYGKINLNKDDGWYHYEPTTVLLNGTIVSELKYGPPNYGESPKTDQKILIYKLVLKNPIKVKRDPKSEVNGDSFENVTEVQLLHDFPLKRFENKTVRLSGTLSEKISGHHFTDVLMKVEGAKFEEDIK